MSQYRIINLSLFGVALWFASIFPSLSSSSAEIVLTREQKFLQTLSSNQNLLREERISLISQKNQSEQILSETIIKSPQQSKADSNLLIAGANATGREINGGESRLELTKRVSLSIFLLFFIPFGIFYPLFLFYRRLLNFESKKQVDPPEPNYKAKSAEPQASVIFDFPVKEDATIATVSKLQIAFSPQARRLRQKLEQITSNEDLNMGQDIVDLMCKTVLALVSQQDWTHVNFSSVSFPLAKIKEEFDLISQTERNKFLNEELSIVNSKQQLRDNYDHDAYRYVVVTLVFSTTHDAPLFSKINTEEQLIEELGKLGKMKQDALIEFELLWNPQQKNKYLTNDQLLMKYSDMIRLL